MCFYKQRRQNDLNCLKFLLYCFFVFSNYKFNIKKVLSLQICLELAFWLVSFVTSTRWRVSKKIGYANFNAPTCFFLILIFFGNGVVMKGFWWGKNNHVINDFFSNKTYLCLTLFMCISLNSEIPTDVNEMKSLY